MTALSSYSTGTVSVAAGGTTVTGVGTIWSGTNVKPGDILQIGNFQSVISDVTDATHLVIPPWGGGAQTGVAYVIWQWFPQRVAGAQVMQSVNDLVAALDTSGFFVFVDVDLTAPDPSLGDDGQYAFQPTTGKTWVKAAGVWTYLGIYKAFQLKGAWSGATAYTVNDVVSFGGSSYACSLDHTNHTPGDGTTQISPPSTTAAAQGYTMVDRTAAVPNGTVVTKVGLYSTTARTVKVKVALRVSAGSYTFVVDQSYSHTGSGWEDVTLSSPYTVPGAGTYYLAAYIGSTANPNVTASVARAYISSDATGTVTLTEDSAVSGAFALRYVTPNTAYWQLLAAKGDTGATGATGPAGTNGTNGAGYGGTSTTSRTIGVGSHPFTTQAGLAYTNGARVRATATAGATGWVEGVATYSGTTLTITSDKTSGSGTGTSWNLNLAGEPGAGDLSSANNFSDVANKLTSANNLQVVSFGGSQSLTTGQKVQAQINAGVRTVLTASANYYVNGSTGNDANDGLTTGTAFATPQKAMDVIAALDCSTFDVTVNVANGTYAALVLKSYLGSGTVTFQGNNTTPSSVVLSSSGAAISTTAVGGRFTVSGTRVQSSVAQDVAVSSATSVTIQNMEYNGSSANFRIYVNSGGQLICAGANHKVLTGGIGLFLVGDGAAKLTTSSSTFNFGANVTYSGATFTARRFGYCECPSMTFSLGGFTVTGQRHAIAQCSGTAGAGVSTFFPGTVGGTTDATSFFG